MSEMYNIASNIIINIFISSIPENLFAVIFCMILLDRFDALGYRLSDIERIAVPVTICAFITTTLRTLVTKLSVFMPVIGAILLTLFICWVYDVKGLKTVLKFCICSFLSLIIVGLIQTSYLPLLLLVSDKPVELLQTPNILSFMWTFPERFIEIGLIAFILIKKTSPFKVNFFKTIVESKLLTVISITILICNIMFLSLTISLILKHKILHQLSVPLQVLSLVVILLLPMINLFTLFAAIYHVKMREIQKMFNIQEELRVSISDISFFLKRGEYARITNELKYLEKDTDQLYKKNA